MEIEKRKTDFLIESAGGQVGSSLMTAGKFLMVQNFIYPLPLYSPIPFIKYFLSSSIHINLPLVLFYFILFYIDLFYFVLFYFLACLLIYFCRRLTCSPSDTTRICGSTVPWHLHHNTSKSIPRPLPPLALLAIFGVATQCSRPSFLMGLASILNYSIFLRRKRGDHEIIIF